jgi:hypothetical protein
LSLVDAMGSFAYLQGMNAGSTLSHYHIEAELFYDAIA